MTISIETEQISSYPFEGHCRIVAYKTHDHKKAMFAIVEYRHTGYCCGERRLGNFWYTHSPTDSLGQFIGSMLTEDEIIDAIFQIINKVKTMSGNFFRGNMNGSYPLWHKGIMAAGFKPVLKWKNGHGFMTEYAWAYKTFGEFEDFFKDKEKK